ncbi:MAG: SPFH domain-containing protein [Acidimicrobiales bacterium]
MPLFEGHKDKGIQRLFIEMPDAEKDEIAWKWPDQQIVQHSQVNVDLDYQAVFTNLGKVIGVMGPGRWPLDEGASLALGWLVDRLTGDAYYDAELYYVTTRDIAGQEFGGPVDNLTDGPTGLVVSLRVFGELAFHVTDPAILLAKLIGTDGVEDFNGAITTWVTDQTQAAIRAVLPDLVQEHGVLAMGQLQDATGDAALAKANTKLAPYGLALTTFAQLNINLPDADAQEIKQFAAAKAYTGVAGSFDSGVRGEATLDIAQGVAAGNVGAQPGIVAGLMMGVPVGPGAAAGSPPAPVPGQPVAPAATGTPAGAHFCTQCGAAIPVGSRFCPNCGAAVAVAGAAPAVAVPSVEAPEAEAPAPPAGGPAQP